MGSKQQQPIAPAPPPAPPTLSQSYDEYLKVLPKAYETELQYAPKFAQSDLALAQQYYPEYTKLMNDVQTSLYPETAGLQEKLAKQASEGMSGDVPDFMRSKYLDQLRSEIGPNAGSGIGADYVSNNLLNLSKSYQDYYRDLALSVTGRLPLTGVATPGFRSNAQGMDANSAFGYQSTNYGNYVNALVNQPFIMPQSRGFNLGGAGAGALSGAATGAMLGSVIPGLGTAAGAGIGGLAGIFGGGFR